MRWRYATLAAAKLAVRPKRGRCAIPDPDATRGADPQRRSVADPQPRSVADPHATRDGPSGR